MAYTVREIISTDNASLAVIVRQSLLEFNAAKEGTVYFDPTTDSLYELFKHTGSRYFVAEEDGSILGGAGIFPTEGLPKDTCELVKFYLHPTGRGKGIGKYLMHECERAATALGYTTMYLETMPELRMAIPLYEKMGYTYLNGPLGNSGHSGCDVWMIKRLAS